MIVCKSIFSVLCNILERLDILRFRIQTIAREYIFARQPFKFKFSTFSLGKGLALKGIPSLRPTVTELTFLAQLIKSNFFGLGPALVLSVNNWHYFIRNHIQLAVFSKTYLAKIAYIISYPGRSSSLMHVHVKGIKVVSRHKKNEFALFGRACYNFQNKVFLTNKKIHFLDPMRSLFV